MAGRPIAAGPSVQGACGAAVSVRPARRQTPLGYYALPILHGDQLVGKLDATPDRPARVLRINAIHQDVPF
jgi:uncharacterized protein YcaQ